MKNQKTKIIKRVLYFIFCVFIFSCTSVDDDFDFVDLSKSTTLQSPETILRFDDKYPVSVKVKDSLLFVIYVKADTCVEVYNIETKRKIKSLGPVGHGADDLINPNFILSADNDRVLLDEGNLRKIVEIAKDDAGDMRLKDYIPYPDSLLISSETNLSEKYIAGRKVDANDGNLFIVYNRDTGKILEAECPFTLNEPIADYNYTFASIVALNERQNRIMVGMYFFDLVHVYDLEGKHINTFKFSERCIPDVNKNTRRLALENGYSGFIRCFPTEKYCYLLRMTTDPAAGKTEKMLVQTDWNGNLVHSYRFADNVSGQFYIDEPTHRLYIIRNSWDAAINEEVFEIVSFKLK